MPINLLFKPNIKMMNILSKIKMLLRNGFIGSEMFQRPVLVYAIENDMLENLFVRSSPRTVRKLFNIPESQYGSQGNQDVFALIMNRFQSGYFVEVGANDGFELSNTVLLEEEFNWSGLLIEANPKYVGSLDQRNRSTIVNKAVASKPGRLEFIDAGLYGGIATTLDKVHSKVWSNGKKISVEAETLDSIFDSVNAPDVIDFISVDVEGADVDVLEQMMQSSRRYRCGCIEHNNRKDDCRKMISLLKEKGYEPIWIGQRGNDLFFKDSKY